MCRSAPKRVFRRWTLAASVLGLVAFISGAVFVSTRPKLQGAFSLGQRPVGPQTTPPAEPESNRPTGLTPESAASSSNWDAITAWLQNDDAAAALASRANALLATGDPKGAVRALEEALPVSELVRSLGAVRALEEALRRTPEDENLHYNLGIAYGQSGDLTNAEHHYREALRLFPDFPEVRNNLGKLLLGAGRLGEAEEQFTEAIKLMPELSSAHNNLGIVRQRQNRMPEAIACFRKAVQCNTNYWQAHFNLAIASLSQGSKDEGSRELQTVLRLNPGYAPAQSALDQLLAQPSKP